MALRDQAYCVTSLEPWTGLLADVRGDFVRRLPNGAVVFQPKSGGPPGVLRAYGKAGWLQSQWSDDFAKDGWQALLSFQHPNAVRFYDIGRGHPSVSVHEFVDGLTMEQLHDECPLPTQLAVYIATALCDALTAMHAQYGLHTKVAPHHVLVSKTGHVKLTGHEEQHIERRTQTSASNIPRPRPLAFISPEGIMGQPVSALSDQYCLGECLATWLTGANPLYGTSPPPTALRQLELRYGLIQGPQPPPALASRSSGLTGELLQILRKAMHNDPTRRFADPGALRAGLLTANPVRLPEAQQALGALVSKALSEPPRPLAQGAGAYCW